MADNRIKRVLRWASGLIILAALVILILWKIPQLQVRYAQDILPKDRFSSENEARKTLATMLGGIVVLAGAYFTWRNIKVAQEGQITDRFTKAIEQLGAVDSTGKKRLEVRLGGIYALERIASQSERDYWPIVEVLSTYVRENAPRRPQESTQENQASNLPPHPTADIQAILTVLGRRDRRHKWETNDLSNIVIRGANLSGANLSRTHLANVDLSEANLLQANLCEADLSGANLSRANLLYADLSRATLTGATLTGATLTGAMLCKAHLFAADFRGAKLYEADLSWAMLEHADLSGADLCEANLRGADVYGAKLRGACSLTQQQIDAAKGNSATELPPNLHMPDSWKK